MRHLNGEIWSELTAGLLTRDHALYWAAHLETGCETCEAIIADLAQQGEIDALDGWVDAALVDDSISGLESAGPTTADLSFNPKAVQRAIRRQRWSKGLKGFSAVAALVAGLFFVFWQRPEAPQWRDKGQAGALVAQLQVMQVEGSHVTEIDLAQALSVGKFVVFSIILNQPACVQLVVNINGSNQEQLEKPICLSAGRQILADANGPLAYRLSQSGAVNFFLQLSDNQKRTGQSSTIKLQVAEPLPDLP